MRPVDKEEPIEKAEFSVHLNITLLGYYANAFLTALRTVIFSSTDDTEFAETIYAYLSGHPELLDLLAKFPLEASVDDLTAKVDELTAQATTSPEGFMGQIEAWGEKDHWGGRDAFERFEDLIKQQPWSYNEKDSFDKLDSSSLAFAFLHDLLPKLRDSLSFHTTEKQLATEVVRLLTESVSGDGDQLGFLKYLYRSDEAWAEVEPGGKEYASELGGLLPDAFQIATWSPEVEGNAIAELEGILSGVPETVLIGNEDVLVPFKQGFVIFLDAVKNRQCILEELRKDFFDIKEPPSWLVGWNRTIEAIGQGFVDLGEGGLGLLEEGLEEIWEDWKLTIPPDQAAFIEAGAGVGTALFKLQLAQALQAGMGFAQIGTNLQDAMVQDPKNAIAGTLLGIAGGATGAFLFIDIYCYLTEPELGWGGWRGDTGNSSFQAGLTAGEVAGGAAQLKVSPPKAVPPSKPTRIGPIGLSFVPQAGNALALEASYTATVPVGVIQDLAQRGVIYFVAMAGSSESPDLFENQFPDQLKDELEVAEDLGAKSFHVGDKGFDDIINEGTVKWVVTEDGELIIMSKYVDGVEINHTVLSGGKPVLAAGEAEIAGSQGSYYGLSIDNHSGHYVPSPESLDIAIQKFSEAGIEFHPGGITRLGE